MKDTLKTALEAFGRRCVMEDRKRTVNEFRLWSEEADGRRQKQVAVTIREAARFIENFGDPIIDTESNNP